MTLIWEEGSLKIAVVWGNSTKRSSPFNPFQPIILLFWNHATTYSHYPPLHSASAERQVSILHPANHWKTLRRFVEVAEAVRCSLSLASFRHRYTYLVDTQEYNSDVNFMDYLWKANWIETAVRTTMVEERLSNLLMISIEKELAGAAQMNHQKLIEAFSETKDEKISEMFQSCFSCLNFLLINIKLSILLHLFFQFLFFCNTC